MGVWSSVGEPECGHPHTPLLGWFPSFCLLPLSSEEKHFPPLSFPSRVVQLPSYSVDISLAKPPALCIMTFPTGNFLVGLCSRRYDGSWLPSCGLPQINNLGSAFSPCALGSPAAPLLVSTDCPSLLVCLHHSQYFFQCMGLSLPHP